MWYINMFIEEEILGPQHEKTCLLGVCKQLRGRPACTSAQSDQHLCYLLIGKIAIVKLAESFITIF